MKRENTGAGKIGGGIGGILAVTMGLALVGLGVFLLLSFATADVRLDPAESAKQCWTGFIPGGFHTMCRACGSWMCWKKTTVTEA